MIESHYPHHSMLIHLTIGHADKPKNKGGENRELKEAYADWKSHVPPVHPSFYLLLT